MSEPLIRRPIENSYVIEGDILVAGEYPGVRPGTPTSELEARLGAFLDSGIHVFIDLTDAADKLEPYEPVLRRLAAKRGIELYYRHMPIRDMDVCTPEQMTDVLDELDRHINGGHATYVHCWGGVGRTGMVVGCWLVRQGASGEQALEQVSAMFSTMSPDKRRRHAAYGSPQTDAQRAMVREWTARVGANTHRLESANPIPSLAATSHARWEHIRPRADVTLAQRDRVRGALLGLAVGDAVGTTVEFRSPGTFEPVTDMIGGGPFHLSPGQWTDDTSMALCLAHSLIERRTFDARDQMQRYVNWRDNGYLSSTDRCFDIGSTVSQSLRRFERDDEPFAGVTRDRTAGNGSLMRLAPIAMYYFDQCQVLQMAADSSRTTHGARVAIDCCRYLAGLIVGAVRGTTKDLLLAPDFEPFPGCWDTEPLHPAVQMVALGSYKRKNPPEIRGRGYVVDALEAALWAFYRSGDYREGCLLAVNLGDDADTTAAIYGQLAGAFHGELGIPAEWRSRLARKDLIDRTAEALFQLAFDRVPALGALTEHALAQRAELLSAEAGDAHQALAKFLAVERAAKEEMGVFEYYMSGPSYGQALHDEVRLQLRIEAGLALQA